MLSEKPPQHLADRRRRLQRSRCDSEKTDGINKSLAGNPGQP